MEHIINELTARAVIVNYWESADSHTRSYLRRLLHKYVRGVCYYADIAAHLNTGAAI